MGIAEKHEKMLYPMVRITAEKTHGSGTIIYSEPNPKNKNRYDTYILTNEHVIDFLIKIEKKWSNIFKRKIEKDILGTPEIETFKYEWSSRIYTSEGNKASIVAYDKEEDLALLKLRSPEKYPYPAKLYPIDKVKELKCFMGTYTIGCGLGEKPVITQGFLSGFGYEIENKEFIMNTAPSIFGNSGGACFLESTNRFIGVPSRLSVILLGFSADAITHMGYIIPIWRVCKFLKDQYFHFIYDNNYTLEQCEQMKKEAKERDELKMLKRLKSE